MYSHICFLISSSSYPNLIKLYLNISFSTPGRNHILHQNILLIFRVHKARIHISDIMRMKLLQCSFETFLLLFIHAKHFSQFQSVSHLGILLHLLTVPVAALNQGEGLITIIFIKTCYFLIKFGTVFIHSKK